MIVFMMWIRWTLPRFRYDTLMDLAWKSLIPLALINLVATAVDPLGHSRPEHARRLEILLNPLGRI